MKKVYRIHAASRFLAFWTSLAGLASRKITVLAHSVIADVHGCREHIQPLIPDVDREIHRCFLDLIQREQRPGGVLNPNPQSASTALDSQASLPFDSPENRELIQKALDLLGQALANHDHVWTQEERSSYESAVAMLQVEAAS